MLYAILAYHVEEKITALTPEEDAALMTDLARVNPTAVYEIRPIRLYLPGLQMPHIDAED